jgi:hypothetical protein
MEYRIHAIQWFRYSKFLRHMMSFGDGTPSSLFFRSFWPRDRQISTVPCDLLVWESLDGCSISGFAMVMRLTLTCLMAKDYGRDSDLIRDGLVECTTLTWDFQVVCVEGGMVKSLCRYGFGHIRYWALNLCYSSRLECYFGRIRYMLVWIHLSEEKDDDI